MGRIKGIVWHWVANPKTTALANRNFFENRKRGKSGFGSAHEIIDLNGDVILCIPHNEMAYHVGSKSYTTKAKIKLSSYPNNCTYGIECTHINWNGKMSDATYKTLINRTADLCIKFNLNPLKDIWLHHDVVGWKDCHRWFVNHPDKFKKAKKEVNNKVIQIKSKVKRRKSVVFKYKWEEDLFFDSLDHLEQRGLLNNKEMWKNKYKKNQLTSDSLSLLTLTLLSRHIVNTEKDNKNNY